jgi:peptidoglycan hydrolase-like protein with peptidoglycan-binding domain
MTTATAIRTTTSTTTSTKLLQRGAEGAEVYELQRLLKDAGVPTGPIDGDFGALTQAAVKRFQSSKGLTVDGAVGPTTWAALRAAKSASLARAQPELRSGDFGGDVTRAQQLLEKHGFSPGGVDGNFGPRTQIGRAHV